MLNNLEDPVQTPAQALKNALILAITAETEAGSKQCLQMAKGLPMHVVMRQVIVLRRRLRR